MESRDAKEDVKTSDEKRSVVRAPKRLRATLKEKELFTEEIGRFLFSMSEPVPFTPGQYVNFRFPGEQRFHAFSIASSPERPDQLEFFIKHVGGFTTRLFTSEPGVELECMAPLGRFMEAELASTSDIVMIAGGVGVTPFLSVLRWARDEKITGRDFWLFWSARTRKHLFAEEELREMGGNLHVVFTLTRETPEGWDGALGHIKKELLLQYLGTLEGKVFFTCGPGRMVAALTTLLAEAGVPAENIKRESWG